MQASAFDEIAFFRASADSGVRALLFQRRYPTPAERLAATRVLAAQWSRPRSR